MSSFEPCILSILFRMPLYPYLNHCQLQFVTNFLCQKSVQVVVRIYIHIVAKICAKCTDSICWSFQLQ